MSGTARSNPLTGLETRSGNPVKTETDSSQPALPKILLSDISGHPVMISGLSGHPLLVINFLATWCAPCLREIPSLLRLVRESRGHVRVVGVFEGRESSGNVRNLVKQDPGDWTLLNDPDFRLSSALHVFSLPTSFVVDAEGRIVSKVTGSVDWTDPKVVHYLKSFTSERAGF